MSPFLFLCLREPCCARVNRALFFAVIGQLICRSRLNMRTFLDGSIHRNKFSQGFIRANYWGIRKCARAELNGSYDRILFARSLIRAKYWSTGSCASAKLDSPLNCIPTYQGFFGTKDRSSRCLPYAKLLSSLCSVTRMSSRIPAIRSNPELIRSKRRGSQN